MYTWELTDEKITAHIRRNEDTGRTIAEITVPLSDSSFRRLEVDVSEDYGSIHHHDELGEAAWAEDVLGGALR